jgi:hypothetical protein
MIIVNLEKHSQRKVRMVPSPTHHKILPYAT